MSTPRPPEHELDPEIAARYRTASEQADEAPAPEVRAAVLAAAARGAAADVSRAPSAGPRAPGKRWPLAAAAAVVLSSIAILLATQVERSTTEAPTALQSEAQIANDRPAAPSASAAPAAAKPAESVKAEQPRQAPEKTRRSGAAALAAPDRVLESRVAPVPAAEPESSTGKIDVPAPPAAIAPSAGVLRSDAESGARPAAPAPASTAPAAAMRKRASPEDAASTDVLDEADPQRWIERIVKLRSTGDDVRADAEVRRFRARYPAIVLPPAALARTGTR